jgi:N6-adenosine-specific RNA methylase IME4
MRSASQVFGQTVGRAKYRLIYADPPWAFKTFSETGHARSSEAHYDCMDVEGIRSLPVGDLAEKDCVLLLWVRDPMLPAALDVINSWGFQFKTVGFYWAKLNKSAPEMCFAPEDFFTGLGYWTRGNVEQCLLATRGKPARKSKAVRKLIVSPRREHSRKPDEIYDRIERLVDGPYLELFSRTSRQGWESWGAEGGLFDQGIVRTRRRSSYSRPKMGRLLEQTSPPAAAEPSFDEFWATSRQDPVAE